MKYNVRWSDDNGVVRICAVDVTVKRDASAVIIDIVKPEWRVGRRDYAYKIIIGALMQARLLTKVRVDDTLAHTHLALWPGSGFMGRMTPKRGVSNPGWKAMVLLDMERA